MDPMRNLRRLAWMVGVGLMVAAISTEMSKPPERRTWQGTLAGFIPYDFRPPSYERIREAYWNPSDRRLFTPRVLGVGWAINLHRAGRLLESGFRALMGERELPPLASRPLALARGVAARAAETVSPI